MSKRLSNYYRRRYPTAEPDDLTQDIAVALLQAKQRWKPNRGAKFSTFAWTRVLRAVHTHVARRHGATRYALEQHRLPPMPLAWEPEAVQHYLDAVAGRPR